MDTNNQNNYFYETPKNDAEVNQPKPAQAQYNPALYAVKKKEYRKLDRKDTIFIFISIILGFLFFNLAVFNGFNLGFTLFYLVLFICSTVYLKREKVTAFPVICGALSLIGSVYFPVFKDDLISFFMFVLVMGLYAIYCTGLSNTFNHRLGSIKSLFDVALNGVFHPFKNMPEAFGSMKASSKKNKTVIGIIIGVAVSFPVLLVVIPLLIKSDAAFEGLVTSILENIGIVIVQLILGVIISPYIFSYFLGNKRKSNKKSKASSNGFAKVPSVICTTFLAVISFTYLVYLFSQLAYFFSAFKGILPDDYEYTASAFARRGFFEMFAICVINVLIISAVNILSKRNDKKKIPVIIKALSAFISAFSVVLIATAMQKMKLNISIFGFTRNRILVSVFMIMILVIIAFFIIHIFAPKITYVQPIIICCSVIFIALAFSNVNAFVANYNIDAYKTDKIDSLDVNAVSCIETASTLIELSKDTDKEYSNEACAEIDNLILYSNLICYKDGKTLEENGELEFVESYDFRNYNYSTYKNCSLLIEYINSMSAEEKKQLQQRVNDYYETKWEDEYDEEVYDDKEYYEEEITDENTTVYSSKEA